MLRTNDIGSLTDFQRNTRQYLRRLKKTGRPAILTINGEAAVVVQDALAYQDLLDAAELADSARILRQRLAAADRGAEGVSAKMVLSAMRKTLAVGKRR